MSHRLPNRSTLGLALSGGTAKVIAHLGVLKALEEEGLRPNVIVGTSGGALIAVFYAAGVPVDEIVQMAEDVTWKRLATLRLPRLGFLSNQGIEDFIRDHLGDIEFEQLQIPTKVITTNLLTGEKVVFSQGPLAKVVRASCSVPQIFSPVEIDGGLHTDGGVIEYLPLETLSEEHCTVDVGVNVGAYADFSQMPRNLIGMMLRVIGVVAVRNARQSEHHADILLRPDLSGFGSFDLSRASEMVDVGYRCALEAAPLIREMLEQRVSVWGRLRARLTRSRPILAED